MCYKALDIHRYYWRAIAISIKIERTIRINEYLVDDNASE